MDREIELMTITMEECAEVIQACSKIVRFGATQKNLAELNKEIGDLYCMLDLLHGEDMISWTTIDDQAELKREKLKVFSNLYQWDED